MKRAIFTLGGLILVFSLCASAFRQWPAAEAAYGDQDAVEAAQAWLALVDQRDYAASYNAAGAYFKAMVTEEQWAAQVGPVRQSLGDLISRKVKHREFTKTLTGAPDGEYYIVTFATVLRLKAKATETVTMAKEADGQWRAVGYFVR